MAFFRNFRGWAVSVQTDDATPGIFVAGCYRDEMLKTHLFAGHCGWLVGLLAIRHAREVLARDVGAPIRRAPWNKSYHESDHFESMRAKLAEIDRRRAAKAEPTEQLVKEAV